MSQVKYEIIAPASQLPPAIVKTIKYSGSAKSIDIYQELRSLAISLKIVNPDTTNSITVSIDGQPTFTVPKDSLVNLENIQYGNLDIDGTGVGEIVIKTIKLSRLVTNKLIEVN